MSTAEDLAQSVMDLAEAVRAVATDPAEAVSMLSALASYVPGETFASDAVGLAQAAAQAASVALGRRAALVSLARATVEAAPRSYDEAVALRDRVCGLLDDEATRAGDAGEDAVLGLLRDLRAAIGTDLTARAADLARLREVRVNAPLPALVHAYRLYADIGRADEVAAYANAADPLFLPGEFRALDS